MALITQDSRCGSSTIALVIDDQAMELVSIEIVTGSRGIRIELFNLDGTPKGGFTIQPGRTVTQNLNKPQRAAARVKEITKADGSTKVVLAVPYRVSTL